MGDRGSAGGGLDDANAAASRAEVDVAIVIAVFNGAATLERTLDSIAGQTVRPRQVIVMDGGSRDGSQAILGRRSDVVTAWASEPDQGIYDAWNKALKRADAEWVAFLGADDYLWDGEVMARWAIALQSVPRTVPYVYGRLAEVDCGGRVLEEFGRPWPEIRSRMRFEMAIPHPGMLHRRSRFFVDGAFDRRYRIAGDYALLRPVLLKETPVFVDFRVVGAQEGGVSTHPERRVQSVREAGLAILSCEETRPIRWYWALWKNVARLWVFHVFGPSRLERLRNAYRALTGRKRRRLPVQHIGKRG